MQALEIRFYPLTEIKKIMETNRKETITNNLTKWGYCYKWIPYKGVEIIEVPDNNPEHKLKNLLIRRLDLDIQTDIKAFAAFFYKIMDDEMFLTMPWAARADVLKKEFNISTSDRTLRKYNAKLVEQNIMVRADEKYEYWYTVYVNGTKKQDTVCHDSFLFTKEQNIQLMENWFAKRKEYLEQADIAYQEETGNPKATNPNRWKIAMNKLWKTTGTVYYKVKGWDFNAFKDEDIREIYRLSALVIGGITLPEEIDEIVETTIDNN